MDRRDDIERLKASPGFQQLVAMLREQTPAVVEELLSYCKDLPELSPASPKEGKKFIAERDRVSVTLDAALRQLVEETAQSLGVPVSRVVESAVWKYYDKPRLSFQKESDDEISG
jgi:hypothetical protein